MRISLNIDDYLLKKASELTGIKDEALLVRMGLEALIARESARRLADLGGDGKELAPDSQKKTCWRECLILADTSIWVPHLKDGDAGPAARWNVWQKEAEPPGEAFPGRAWEPEQKSQEEGLPDAVAPASCRYW
jgi:hypothetical protein